MTIHGLAALSLQQRKEVRRLYLEGRTNFRQLALRFQVSPTTIRRWALRESPLDLTTAPKEHWTRITPEYRAAVLHYRQRYPEHGPIRIVRALKDDFPPANRGTVLAILQQSGLTRKPSRQKRQRKPIPVGHYRVQADIQTLPAVKGEHGREYKVSFIHLATRYKYSEIHADHTTETVLAVFRRALDELPPFFS